MGSAFSLTWQGKMRVTPREDRARCLWVWGMVTAMIFIAVCWDWVGFLRRMVE